MYINFGSVLNFGSKSLTKLGTCCKSMVRGFRTTSIKSQVVSDCVELSTPKKHWRELIGELNSFIKPENLLGRGSEASVYKINDYYVLRILGRESNMKGINLNFRPVTDVFEGRNFGQAVAISENCSINRLVRGTPLYKCKETDPVTYLKKLKEYSKLPDKTLEQFIEDVSFINKKGYIIDKGNPENFLYDRINKKIGIIDIHKKGITNFDLFNPYGHDWIIEALCNGHNFFDCASKMNPAQRKEMLELITSLESRIIPLCKKYNIPIAKYNNKKYMEFSMAEFLSSKDKINVFSKEGIITQMAKLNHPEYDVETLKLLEPNF